MVRQFWDCHLEIFHNLWMENVWLTPFFKTVLYWLKLSSLPYWSFPRMGIWERKIPYILITKKAKLQLSRWRSKQKGFNIIICSRRKFHKWQNFDLTLGIRGLRIWTGAWAWAILRFSCSIFTTVRKVEILSICPYCNKKYKVFFFWN